MPRKELSNYEKMKVLARTHNEVKRLINTAKTVSNEAISITNFLKRFKK